LADAVPAGANIQGAVNDLLHASWPSPSDPTAASPHDMERYLNLCVLEGIDVEELANSLGANASTEESYHPLIPDMNFPSQN
jgi:hypothetical protein